LLQVPVEQLSELPGVGVPDTAGSAVFTGTPPLGTGAGVGVGPGSGGGDGGGGGGDGAGSPSANTLLASAGVWLASPA
jgi:hypothetical protein